MSPLIREATKEWATTAEVGRSYHLNRILDELRPVVKQKMLDFAPEQSVATSRVIHGNKFQTNPKWQRTVKAELLRNRFLDDKYATMKKVA